MLVQEMRRPKYNAGAVLAPRLFCILGKKRKNPERERGDQDD